MGNKELPVFFDRTGRRWRRAKWSFAIFLTALAAFAAVVIPAVAEPITFRNAGQHSPSQPTAALDDLEKAFNATNVPIVGKGQFIRAVTVRHEQSAANMHDVFSGKFVRPLTADEALVVGKNQYALERYGQLPPRQIVLTFDDGPDPAFTPQLLDLLSENGVPAAFFVVGANVVKHPQIAEREVREGHIVANHTFSHIDFEFEGTVEGEQELNQTGRVMRAATGSESAFVRIPYAGNTDESQRDNIKGLLQAQRLGYVPVSFDYDTNDWKFTSDQRPDPKIFDGTGQIFLLHDSGGNRQFTLNYVRELIPAAKKAGYSFVSMDQAYPGAPLQNKVTPALPDKAALSAGQTVLVWPARFMRWLFTLSVVLTIVVTATNIILATLSKRRRKNVPRNQKYRPAVTVLVPAFNEAPVLEESVLSLLRSKYRNLGVVIIDDGSNDDTLAVARRLADKHARVKVLRQRNLGKATALNTGIKHSSGEIIICVDADTVFLPDTVGYLVQPFIDPKVGGVAGYVRAGNARNMLTKWQALEYITSIALERAAQAFLGAITVVPGACGAWRRTALEAAGGFSDRTLAEDCDIALSVHKAGYQIAQETSAISYTECPLTLGDLAKQRFRWIFGNIQSYWWHRNMFFNKKFGWLGSFVLPNAALSILLPMLFWPLLLIITAANVFAGRWWVIILFPLIIMTFQLMVSWVGLVLAKESMRHLLMVPLTRLVYSPLRTYVLYRSLLTALRGALVGWNKLRRTKTVSVPGHAPPFQAVQPAAEEQTN